MVVVGTGHRRTAAAELGHHGRAGLHGEATHHGEFSDAGRTCPRLHDGVTAAEGLVGAALRRSPALKASPGAPFRHPGIRKWLTFTSERAYARNLAVIAGIADQTPAGAIQPFVRSLDSESGLTGHFHSLVFPYSPLQKGRLDLNARIHQLFDTVSLQDLLHLIHDDRRITGAGQSEFIRGTCWIGEIRDFEIVE